MPNFSSTTIRFGSLASVLWATGLSMSLRDGVFLCLRVAKLLSERDGLHVSERDQPLTWRSAIGVATSVRGL